MSFLSSISSYLQPQTEGDKQTIAHPKSTEVEERDEEETSSPAADCSEQKSGVNNLDEQLNKGVDAAYDYGKKLGGFLYTFASTASQQVKTHADKLVEGTVLQDFNEERDKFEKEQKGGSTGTSQQQNDDSLLPWIGFEDEDEIKRQVLSLSSDDRNFLRDPPQGIQFNFDLQQNFPAAVALLQVDKNLQNMRYNLVPKKLKEDVFWRNYFYRVTLITQSAHLKCMGDQGNKAAATTQEQHAHAQENQKAKDSQDTRKQRVLSNGSTADDPQDGLNQEDFVSDTFDADQEQMEQMRKEIESLEKKTDEGSTNVAESQGADGNPADDDLDEIEKELEDLDATDFEVVNDGENSATGSTGEETGAAGWENELEQMLENEVSSS